MCVCRRSMMVPLTVARNVADRQSAARPRRLHKDSRRRRRPPLLLAAGLLRLASGQPATFLARPGTAQRLAGVGAAGCGPRRTRLTAAARHSAPIRHPRPSREVRANPNTQSAASHTSRRFRRPARASALHTVQSELSRTQGRGQASCVYRAGIQLKVNVVGQLVRYAEDLG